LLEIGDYILIIKLKMSDEKLPIVSFKNILEKQEIAHRMFNHRRRLLEL